MEWISVDDSKKPDDGDLVLAYTKQTDVYFVARYVEKGNRFWHNSGFYLTLPTHWAQIEPPKDGD